MDREKVLKALDEFIEKMDPTYLKLQKVADRYLPLIERAYYKAFIDFQKTINVESMATLGDIRKINEHIRWHLLDKFLEPVYDLIAMCTVDSLEIARKYGNKSVVHKALHPSFNIRNNLAVRWAQGFAGREIVEVSSTTQKAVSKIISNALQYGGHPYETAREIRQHIGLTEYQMQSVVNYQAELDQSGRSKRDIDNMVDSYIRKKIRQRANTIARTETMKAANMGQQLHWNDMITLGYLNKSANVKVWIATKGERTCPTCMALDGKTVEIDGNFTFEGFNGLTPPLHPLCFSDDTEVFTENGWKLFKNVTLDEKVWTMTMDTKELVLDTIKQKVEYFYEGPMVHFNSRCTDSLVTPDHSMLVETSWNQEFHPEYPFSFRKAIDMKVDDRIPRTAYKWNCSNNPETILGFPAKEFMQFMGWYISEGSCCFHEGCWQINISQLKEHYRTEIIELCTKLFPKIWIGKDNIIIPYYTEELPLYLKALGYSYQKYVPQELKELSSELLQEMLTTLIKGDGTIDTSCFEGYTQKEPYYSYVTSSKRLVNDLTEISLKLSKSLVIRETEPGVYDDKRADKVYQCNHVIYEIGWRVSTFKKSCYNKSLSSIVEYSGTVVCLEMDNNPTLFTKRNGKTIWTGNCRCAIGIQERVKLTDEEMLRQYESEDWSQIDAQIK